MAANAGAMMKGDVASVPDGTQVKYSKDDHPKGKLRRVEIEVADNGGFIIKEYFEQPSRRSPYGSAPMGDIKTHSVSGREELDQLLDECLDLSGAYESDDDESAGDETDAEMSMAEAEEGETD